MCFRPSSAEKSARCPKCNMLNPMSMKVCRKCGAELPGEGAPLKPPVLKKEG